MTNMVQRYARQRAGLAGNWKPSYLRKVIRVPEKTGPDNRNVPSPGPVQCGRRWPAGTVGMLGDPIPAISTPVAVAVALALVAGSRCCSGC